VDEIHSTLNLKLRLTWPDAQAGILHGTNDGIVAFRCYERDRQHLMALERPA
jgi:hypothetical protein